MGRGGADARRLAYHTPRQTGCLSPTKQLTRVNVIMPLRDMSATNFPDRL
jgi:hypothetical protein